LPIEQVCELVRYAVAIETGRVGEGFFIGTTLTYLAFDLESSLGTSSLKNFQNVPAIQDIDSKMLI
jgi:hypothetical protein